MRHSRETLKFSSVLIVLGFFCFIWPIITSNRLFDVIVNIRTAITTGDGGLLILTIISTCVFFMLPSFFIYICLDLVFTLKSDLFHHFGIERNSFIIFVYGFLLVLSQIYGYYPIEPVTSFIGLILTLILVWFSTCQPSSIMPKLFIGLQVFLVVQWANIVPSFNDYNLGSNDLFISLKVASDYLDTSSNIKSIAIAFVLPLFISSLMTAFIVKLYNQNLAVAEENFQHELDVKAMQKKIMTNRSYQEINALAHDLKTPLVTIQGLMSLLALTKDSSKIESYGHTVNEAIQKMTDMISSFLYGNMKESIEVLDLVNYIRTQIPVEDEGIHFSVYVEEGLPALQLNKIRMARALINLVENAILAPTKRAYKTIVLRAFTKEDHIVISLADDGQGIKPEDLEKIWTIGYSTNETSGLGLPFTKQTVLENNGTIELVSTYGKGTTANIYFPLSLSTKRSIPNE